MADDPNPQAEAPVEILKILIGVQEGAEIGLENRQSYAIGTSDECHIVLIGEEITPVHIEAAYLGGLLSILKCEEDVKLDGQDLPQLPTSVLAGQVLSFASIALAFGKPDDDWEALKEKASEILSDQPAAGLEAEEPEQVTVAPSRSRVPTIVTSTLLILALIGSGAWYAISDDPADPTSAAAENDSSERSEQDQEELAPGDKIRLMLVSSDDYQDVEFNSDQGAKGSLVGIVDSDAAEKKLRKMASEAGIRWRVASERQLLEGLRLALDKYDAGLIYDLETKGGKISLKISGIRDSANIEVIEQSIADNLPLIDSVDITATPLDKVLADLGSFLKAKPQYGKVSVNYDGRDLVLSGKLLANYEELLEPGLASILENFGSNAIDLRKELKIGPRFSGKVTSVLLGNARHAVINFRGRAIRVGAGSRLPGDFLLASIDRQKLELEHEGTTYPFPTLASRGI